MTTFPEAWKFVMARSQHGVMTVQNDIELNHVFDLMKVCNCQTYLEVGSAEGNSLYVLGHAAEEISFIDYGEAHTKAARDDAINSLAKPVIEYIGDSTNPETFFKGLHHDRYDCVLIDGGHDYSTVLSDSLMYAPLASKYVFWHDIQLPEVRRAYDWFKARWGSLGEFSEFISSPSFGYGVLRVKT